MPRCKRKVTLEVHHKRRDGGNGLNNAEVLCERCHAATSTYGVQGTSPPDFAESIKFEAKILSGNQCECTRIIGCH
jgi:5-methylcytosine-specific restriction endonuclease McrA